MKDAPQLVTIYSITSEVKYRKILQSINFRIYLPNKMKLLNRNEVTYGKDIDY